MYYDAYPAPALARVARRALRPDAGVRERWVIFDNTAHGHAIADALVLQGALRQLSPSP
jgi:uncharacterized protein YecE (DUF72 family)